MPIDSVRLAASSGLLASTATGASAGSVPGAGTQLAKPGSAVAMNGMSANDFMTLFLAQLKNQDPTKPMDDTAMLTQLSQFTMIDTLTSLDKTMAGTQLAQASSLIGKHVEGKAVDGTAVSGTVEKLIQDTDGIALVVGGKSVQAADITVVTPADTAAAASTPAAGA